MSEALTLAWIPHSLCLTIARQMDGLLSNWATACGLPAPAGAIAVALPGQRQEPGLVPGLVNLAAPPTAEWLKVLGAALFGTDTGESAVFREATKKVVEALQQALAQTFGPPRVSPPTACPAGHAGIGLRVEVLRQPCAFFLCAAQLRASGHLQTVTAPVLGAVNLESALAGTPVPLVAELGRADIGLDELLSLSPGDVLVLKETLDAPLRIVAPGSDLALTAHLGASPVAPMRAARCLAP